MENFEFCASTKVLFGKEQIENLPEIIRNFGKRVLICYGGGSIKRMGLYDKIRSLLPDCELYEAAGIAPNPKVESVREGVAVDSSDKGRCCRNFENVSVKGGNYGFRQTLYLLPHDDLSGREDHGKLYGYAGRLCGGKRIL